MTMEKPTLLCLGLGFSARALVRRLKAGWRIIATSTTPAGAAAIRQRGLEAIVFDGGGPSAALSEALGATTHLLVSAPPGDQGDPLLRHHAGALESAERLSWIGYLSTVGVYGDAAGAWVDEESPLRPSSERSRRRVEAEAAWLACSVRSGARAVVFRLAGIYGPGRSAIDQIRAGTARRIIKPGQVFNRIHVEDIAQVLEASMAGRGRHGIYNVADDEPAPPQDVVAYGAMLLGIEPPPEIAFAEADLSPMGRSFYAEVKRVSNARMKADLGLALAYPSYREGLAAIVAGDGPA